MPEYRSRSADDPDRALYQLSDALKNLTVGFENTVRAMMSGTAAMTPTESALLDQLRGSLTAEEWDRLPELLRDIRAGVAVASQDGAAYRQEVALREERERRERERRELREALEREEQERRETEARRRRAAADRRLADVLRSRFADAEAVWREECSDVIDEAEFARRRRAYVTEWAWRRTGRRPDPDQADVIAALGGDVQFAARAGSGKASVLVSRGSAGPPTRPRPAGAPTTADAAQALLEEYQRPATVHELASEALRRGVFLAPEALRDAMKASPRFESQTDRSGVVRFALVAGLAPQRQDVVERLYDPRQPVPEQVMAQMPDCLEAACAARGQWSLRFERIESRLCALETDRVVVHVSGRADSAGAHPGDTQIMIEKVLDYRPWFVCAAGLSEHDSRLVAERAGWHLWDPRRPITWRDSSALVTASPLTTHRCLLGTWRSANTVAAAQAAVGLASQLAGVSQPQFVKIAVDECPPAELSERLLAVRDVPRPNRDAVGHPRSFDSGHCRLCGRPLEDPDSVARGVGPVCASRLHLDLLRTQRQVVLSSTTPIEYWVGARSVEEWNGRMRRDLLTG